jgi:hypothetical protein
VRDLDALAGAGEQHRVVAHDVAPADGREADGRRVALAGDAFARVDRALLQVSAQRIGDHLAHLERGARGRIDLVAVVRFDDLDVVAGRKRLGRHFEQLEGDVDADAHVGRHHDRDVFRCRGDLGLLRVAEAGGADHGLHAQFAADGEVRQRAFGPREVDQHLGVLEAGAQVGHDRDAARGAEKGGRIAAERRAAGDIERTGEAAILRLAHGLDQHVPHAPGSACDRDAPQRGNGGGRRGISHAFQP